MGSLLHPEKLEGIGLQHSPCCNNGGHESASGSQGAFGSQARASGNLGLLEGARTLWKSRKSGASPARPGPISVQNGAADAVAAGLRGTPHELRRPDSDPADPAAADDDDAAGRPRRRQQEQDPDPSPRRGRHYDKRRSVSDSPKFCIKRILRSHSLSIKRS